MNMSADPSAADRSDRATDRRRPAQHAMLPDVWRAFLAGLTGCSTLSLVVAFGLAALLCWLGARHVTEEWVIEHGDLLSHGPTDLELDVTRAVLRITHDPAPLPAVVLLGRLGSQSPYSPEMVDEVWHKVNPNLPPLVDLRMPDPTMYEVLVLGDQFPRSWRALPVIVLSLDDLLVDVWGVVALENRPRLGVRSAQAGLELQHIGIQAVPLRWNYFVDNQAFLLSRARDLLTNLRDRPADANLPGRREQLLPDQRARRVAHSFTGPEPYLNRNFLDRLLIRLRRADGPAPLIVVLSDNRFQEPRYQQVAALLMQLSAKHQVKLGWTRAASESRAGLSQEIWHALRSEAQAMTGATP